MKKILLFSVFLILLIGCKKKEFAPEGPTDIRIRNSSSQLLTEITVKTSEYAEDVTTIASLAAGATSEYHRFKKAYPKAEISAKVNVGGSSVLLSTGAVSYTYMQYLSTQRVTFVIDIEGGKVVIENVIPEEELVLK